MRNINFMEMIFKIEIIIKEFKIIFIFKIIRIKIKTTLSCVIDLMY